MTARTHPDTRTLYDRDFNLWIEATAKQLRSGEFSELDLENLIEEVESMGRSQKHSIASLLDRLLEHLLKLAYWESERERNANHWNGEINVFRTRIYRLLADSPSLKPYLREIFEDSYEAALETVQKKMGLKKGALPSEPICSLEQTLDNDWLPIDLDGE
ncbi:DUF29 domain-containing protein [Pannus brasiliensis CCIBt3594]|uniref:DUF29 domain-containing protein n=1 Tax=Pannus brasiliensis CCIBt3594 TaxID=1427578 RepID=A0AAW9QE35_9CHRO